MHPTFHIFGSGVPGYGAMISLGILVTWTLASIFGNRSRVGPDMATSLLISALLGGFLGGKALAVLTEWDYYGKDLSRVINASQGGVAYGAIIGGLALAAAYARFRKYRVLDSLDVTALLICIGQIFGRLGCFLAGCCYGKPGEWGVSFPKASVAFKALRSTPVSGHDGPLVEGAHTVPLIPTQLIESGFLLLFSFLLIFLLLRKLSGGTVFFTYLIGYAVFRFIIEMWRLDPERGFVIDGLLSTSQFIACLMFVLGLLGFALRKKTSPSVVA
jgi:phosphatidylglycerol---prolipoprotein diacylglyceryl transferase